MLPLAVERYHTSPVLDSLPAVIREKRFADLRSTAELIDRWPQTAERKQEAKRCIHEAMLLNTLGQITQPELSSIYTILSFAMPNDYWVEGEPTPTVR